MPETHDRPLWYRSLYWRIALGFIVCVAVVLLAQAVLFLWLASRANPALTRSPQDLVAIAAVDLSSALEADGSLDIGRHVGREYGRAPHPLIVVMVDGSVHRSRAANVPPPLLRFARTTLMREAQGLSPSDPDPGELPPDEPRRRAPPPDGGGIRMRIPRRPAMGRIVRARQAGGTHGRRPRSSTRRLPVPRRVPDRRSRSPGLGSCSSARGRWPSSCSGRSGGAWRRWSRPPPGSGPAIPRRGPPRPAATKSRSSPGVSTAWPRISTRGFAICRRRIAPGDSCSPTSLTS